MTDENQQPQIDAWRVLEATTDHLRNTADLLRQTFSRIEIPNAKLSDEEVLKRDAVKYLALAAEHIDRLYGQCPPILREISSTTSINGELYLFGLDNYGQLWQYIPPIGNHSAGWELCNPLAVPNEPETEEGPPC